METTPFFHLAVVPCLCLSLMPATKVQIQQASTIHLMRQKAIKMACSTKYTYHKKTKTKTKNQVSSGTRREISLVNLTL